MDNNTSRTIRSLSIAIVIILLLAIIGFFIYNALTFRVTGTNPSSGKVTTISPFFKINFNKSLSSSGLSISSKPNIIKSYKVDGRTLDITLPVPLRADTVYTITLSSVYSTNQRHITNKVFSFTPSDASGKSIPKDQSQTLLNNQVQYNKAVNSNPLLKQLPFMGPGNEFKISYSLDYQSDGPKPIVYITAQTPEAQQDALTWIKSRGYDTDNVKLVMVTGPPLNINSE